MEFKAKDKIFSQILAFVALAVLFWSGSSVLRASDIYASETSDRRNVHPQNVVPTLEFREMDLVSDVADQHHLLVWTDSDPDDGAHIFFFYDSNETGKYRMPINIEAIEEDDPKDSLTWDTSTLEDGLYHLYAIIHDKVNEPVVVYRNQPVVVRHGADCTEPDFENSIHGNVVSHYGGSLVDGQVREAEDVSFSQPWATNQRVGDFICIQTATHGTPCYEIIANYLVVVDNVVGCGAELCPGIGTFNEYVVAENLTAPAEIQPGNSFGIYAPKECAVSAVRSKPIFSGGYLLFDSESHPEVHQWQVQISRRSYGEGGLISEKIVEVETLPAGVDFKWVLPEHRVKSLSAHYVAEVSGLDELGSVFFTESGIHLNDANHLGPDIVAQFGNGLESYLPTECRKTCISDFYAYTIQQYKKPTTVESRFEVERAFRAFDPTSTTVNPYYWYTLTPPTRLPADPTALITFISGSNGNVTVRDPNGVSLVGRVYGHRKGLGPWGGSTVIATNRLALGDEFCSDLLYPLTAAINLMNNHGDFTRPGMPPYPPLDCIPENASSVGVHNIPVEDLDPDDGPAPGIKFTFCLVNGVLVPCENQPADKQRPLNPKIIDEIVIENLQELTAEPRSINFRALLVEVANDTFEDVQFTLEPGLYAFGFACKDGIYRTGFRELTTPVEYVLTEADLLNLFDFPAVPALDFDGKNDYIEVENTAALNAIGSGDFTLEAWYLAEDDDQLAHPMIFSNRPVPGVGFTFFFHNNWNGSPHKIPAVQLNGINYVWTEPPELLDGTWHHFAARKKGETLTYFSDGHEIKRFSGIDILNADISADHPLWIGWDNASLANTPWNGRLDELRIWNRALDPEEIQANMYESLVGDEPGLVASWSLSEGAGQTITDATGVHVGRLGSTFRSDENDALWVDNVLPLVAPLEDSP